MLQGIYGCIELLLLWYKIYTKNLHKNGYKFNQYDRCMANNTIEGKGCTVPWYVDYNKASHVNPKLIGELLEYTKKHFGDMEVTRRGNHCDIIILRIYPL